MRSPHLIKKIMEAREPVSDPGGIPGGLRWDVPGSFRNSEGVWELVLDSEKNIIFHFNFRSVDR